MPDYSKSIIYTIRTRESVYVGSTTNFTQRKHNHNNHLKIRNSKLYKTIIDNDGEWDMKPYKIFPCNSKMELDIEEEKVKQELNADLNTKSCYGLNVENDKRNKKDYYQANKEYLKQKQKEHYQANKEYFKQKQKDYYQAKK